MAASVESAGEVKGVIGHSIPGWSDDGASHRVNCDTPPLKGYCQGTLFLIANVVKLQMLTKFTFLARNQSIGARMAEQAEKREKNLRRLRGRVARSRSIGTKVTPDEERQILAAAEAEGKAPSEWARDLLLRGAVTSNRGEMEMHLFTELVGIQMLLMNALEPLFRDEKWLRNNSPPSTAESRQPRPRRPRNSWQSAI